MSHPLFEIVRTTAGVTSIRNKLVNEIMHNPVGPWVEANELYVQQSHLQTRLREAQEELVIYDVGLGAAANALAILHCAEGVAISDRRPLHLISFEKDVELLRFARAHSDEFEHFRRFLEAIDILLAQGEWKENGIRWELREGDFVELIAHEKTRPHLIYFDPYSPKVNDEMWTVRNFQQLRSRCRTLAEGGTILYTYTQATPIRTALLLAGFSVGYGQPTGLKEETTQAASDLSLLSSPLGDKWLRRWRASHTAIPTDRSDLDRESLEGYLLALPQFTGKPL